MAKRNIKAGKPAKSASRIHSQDPKLDSDVVRFSFKHLDLSHAKFSIREQGATYLHSLMERLKALSSLRTQELLSSRSSSLRCHPIEWDKTSEPKGFAHLNTQLQDIPPMQFQISSNAHGRVHGFFINNVFFVVWLDCNHSLYPRS